MKRTVFMSMTTLGLLFFSCGLFAQSAEQIRKKAADVVDQIGRASCRERV